ncbi:hypothetical protein TNCV_1601901 [Trichonephila clavipes]|nr:hypothetical protein TNCV_1601901 [Trichonephila clavipes]
MDFLPLVPLIMSLSKVGLPDPCESERTKLRDLNLENHLCHLRTSKALGLEEHNRYELFIFAMRGQKGSTTGNVHTGRTKKRTFLETILPPKRIQNLNRLLSEN